MPEMDGIELLKQVRAEYPDLPFILFTGKGSEEVASEAISEGATEYMQKETGMEQYEVLANRIENVTEASRFHQELEMTEAKHKRLLEQSLVGVYVIQNGEFEYVNSKFASIFGYTQEEVIESSVLDLVAESDKELVEENLRRRLDGGVESIRYSFNGVRNDEEVINVEAHGGRIEANGSAVMGTLVETGEEKTEPQIAE
jgi:PAS domain S-box-containing protein